MNFRAFVTLALLVTGAVAAQGQDAADLTLTTKSAEALELYNRAQEKLDNLLADEARGLFEQATQADPEFAMAYLGWANTSNTQKDFQARLDMAVARAADASEPERLLIQSAQAQNVGDARAAGEHLRRAAELLPQSKRVLFNLGNFYYGQQDYVSAEKEYRRVIEIDPNFAPVYNIYGYLLSNQNRYPEALEILKKYAELRPADNNPRDSMGEIYLYMGDHQNSIREYGASLAIDSSFVASWSGLGHNHVFMGDFNRARAMYAQLRSRAHTAADSNTSMFWTATSYCHEKKYDKAIAMLEEQYDFVRARDNFALGAVILGQVAEIYREIDQPEKALAAARAEREVAARPEISEGARETYMRDAIFTEAVAFARLEKPDSAAARLEEYRRSAAESTSPLVAGNLNTLEGILAFYGKDYATAVEELAGANKFDPIAMHYRAMALEAGGKAAEAEAAFAELAAMNRNSLSYGLTRPWAMAKSKRL